MLQIWNKFRSMSGYISAAVRIPGKWYEGETRPVFVITQAKATAKPDIHALPDAHASIAFSGHPNGL